MYYAYAILFTLLTTNIDCVIYTSAGMQVFITMIKSQLRRNQITECKIL